ncbi:MAG: putrescine transporter permease PotH [Gammaproteobacteria bacterium]|nr:putrescine transporter permease PotH [Gammaproteobacteria bacterium]
MRLSNYDKLNFIRRMFVLMPPYLWLILFLFIPFLFVLKISFATPVIASPPYTPLLEFSNQAVHLTLNFGNYLIILTHGAFFLAFLESIKIAATTTLICILVGYPITYAIATSSPKIRNILFMAVVLPYWTSFLLRAYSWINILQNNGLLNQLLIKAHIIDSPLHLIYNNFSLYLGLTYGYLPFFILPLYATLIKMDRTLLEAAYDLGASPIKSFLQITLPLSLSGILAGALLVFIPCVGEVVIPQLLGGINTLMIGNVIWQEFFVANNWCAAAALAVIMLILLVVPVVMLQRLQLKQGAKA